MTEEFGITPWQNGNNSDSVLKFQRTLNTHLQQRRETVRKLQSQDSLDSTVGAKKITIEDIMSKQRQVHVNLQANERNSGGVYSPVPKSRMEPLGKLLSRNSLY